MVLFGDRPCMTVVDHSGRFGVSGLPLDSIVVVASRPGFCVYPTRVLPRGPGTVDVVLPGLFAGNPLSDAMLMIHGTPWVPPNYEALLAGSVGPYGIFLRRPDFDRPGHAHVQVGLSGRESYDCVVQEVEDRLPATCRVRSP